MPGKKKKVVNKKEITESERFSSMQLRQQKAADIEALRVAEEERRAQFEQQRREEEERLRQEEILQTQREAKEKIRRRLEPLINMRDKLHQKHFLVVKPLLKQWNAGLVHAIMTDDLEINLYPTQEEMSEYFRPLQEKRLKKLRLTLSKQRHKMYKKDYEARQNDIDALERALLMPGWKEQYRKLKIKIEGSKHILGKDMDDSLMIFGGSNTNDIEFYQDITSNDGSLEKSPIPIRQRSIIENNYSPLQHKKTQNSTTVVKKLPLNELGLKRRQQAVQPNANANNDVLNSQLDKKDRAISASVNVNHNDQNNVDDKIRGVRNDFKTGATTPLVKRSKNSKSSALKQQQKTVDVTQSIKLIKQNGEQSQQQKQQRAQGASNKPSLNKGSRIQSIVNSSEEDSSGSSYSSSEEQIQVQSRSVDKPRQLKSMDPARELVLRLKRDKRQREKAQLERQLIQKKENEAKQKMESEKFDELAKKLQEEKRTKLEEKHKKFEEDKLARLKFRSETNKNLQKVKKVRPLYLEKAEEFENEETQVVFRGIASLSRKERIDLNEIKVHSRKVEALTNQKIEQAQKERQEIQKQHIAALKAERSKIGNLKTHFADIVAQENEFMKNKVYEEFETEQQRALARKQYADKVKKPKVDTELKAMLENEIKKPTSFIGRQSAHADILYHNNEIAVPKANYLSAHRQSLPEINNVKINSNIAATRNSIQTQNQDQQPIKKDRDYVRRIIQESKRTNQNLSQDGGSEGHAAKHNKWDQQENRITSKVQGARQGPSKDHKATVSYLEDQRARNDRFMSHQRRISEAGGNNISINHDLVSLESAVSHPASINLAPLKNQNQHSRILSNNNIGVSNSQQQINYQHHGSRKRRSIQSGKQAQNADKVDHFAVYLGNQEDYQDDHLIQENNEVDATDSLIDRLNQEYSKKTNLVVQQE